MELAEVPARDFAHHVVERRLEEGRSGLRHRVLQIKQPVSQSELGGHERQRIACSFRRQRGRTAQAGVHFNHAVVFRFGVEGILHVTLAHDTDVADDADGQLAELVILAVGQRLARRNDDALARVDAQRVEVLHVAHRDAVVEAVAHHLVFHLFPSLQALFHKHLRGEREGFLGQHVQFFLIIAESGAEPSQGVCRTDNDGIAQIARGPTCLFDVFAGFALDGLHVDFVELTHEEFAVFSIHDSLHGGAEHLHAVFFKRARLIERDPAV